MGNTAPSVSTLEQIYYVGKKYRTLQPLYLQKNILSGSHLVSKSLPENDTCSDEKFRTRQWTVPVGSLIEVTGTVLPSDSLGISKLLGGISVPQLQATLTMEGKSLDEVNVQALFEQWDSFFSLITY